ncbi:hypothetical protein P9112_002960 [Eukaryota sp. TZLM1-RC]
MARTARISFIKEPLPKETLSLTNSGSDDRGDVYCDWIENSEAVVDLFSCNVANDTLVQRRKLNFVSAFEFKAKEKHRKYDKDIEEANADRNRPLVFFTVFPFSINGRLSVEAGTFLNALQKLHPMHHQCTVVEFTLLFLVFVKWRTILYTTGESNLDIDDLWGLDIEYTLNVIYYEEIRISPNLSAWAQ